MKAQLVRLLGSDEGTPGWFMLPKMGIILASLELPWRHNSINISRIPFGTYQCRKEQHGRFGAVIRLYDVPGRSGILIHSGNVAGDIALGYRSNVRGCILLGKKHGALWGQQAILQSRFAVTELAGAVDEFELEIRGDL